MRRYCGECLRSPASTAAPLSPAPPEDVPARSLRSLCGLRLPCSRSLRSRERTATAPHASPASRFALSERSPRPSRAGSRPPLRSGRSRARHRTPFIRSRRRRPWVFKYHIAAADLRYSLPLSLAGTSVLTSASSERVTCEGSTEPRVCSATR
uniref:Uncharacterized protein TP009.22 n=1 Tax=Halorubrum sp. TP009 TaxID=447099 RepID=A7U0Y8_9EURY|nr:hypothetical protein [Halorubrum sp. TP009]